MSTSLSISPAPDAADINRDTADGIHNMNIAAPGSSGFFAKAIHTDARYGTFNDYSGAQVKITHEHRPAELAETLASLKPAHGGRHYVHPCLKGTRVYIFKEVDQWLVDLEALNILWLTGNPGAGKSTVASSIVSMLAERERLGASFFFRRGDVALSDPASLWLTVAYSLAQHDPLFAQDLFKTLNAGKVDPNRADIDSHFKFLIQQPFTRLYSLRPPSSIPIIVIDALDECGFDGLQEKQRKTLLDTLVQWSHLPKSFKLIVTGRDYRIPDSIRTVCKRIVLPTGANVSVEANDDIRYFFRKRFADLGGSSDHDWPGEQVLDTLTSRAAGLFIWADIVMGFLEQGFPDDQLKLVLSGDLGEEDNLTKMYRQYLHFSFKDIKGHSLERCRRVIATIILAKVPLRRDDLHLLVSESKPSVNFILNKLSSVISAGKDDDRLRIGHLSFSEFLCDRTRCPAEFFIDQSEESKHLSLACLRRMKECLKFNICDLETSHLTNKAVNDLQNRIRNKIPGSLLYSCQFWAAHLQDTSNIEEGSEILLMEVADFFYRRFLYYVEVMSLIHEVAAANAAMLIVMPWIERFDKNLSAFAKDASRFITNFGKPISDSAPHIYLSALSFSPSESLIAKYYRSQFPNTLSVVSGQDHTWPATVNVFRGHSHTVASLASSPDGRSIVSGSWDGTIRVWDAKTGLVTAGPFEGHNDNVCSVAFLPDGKRVVSGSADRTIRIWDVEEGQPSAAPFEGHKHVINSIAVSSDGKKIVSGSKDRTIRIWNVETGHAVTTLKGHTDEIYCIALSPDGKWVVSGSRDTTVRIWDVNKGQIAVPPFQGHTKTVFCVTFSSDGKRVASGSLDTMVMVTDAHTGQVIAGPFEHPNTVLCVALSSNGMWLVSGSWDKTVRVWHIETGQVKIFEGHSGMVRSVIFSRDDMQVMSGSEDETIRIWDLQMNMTTEEPTEGHTSAVSSVVFSPDGKLVASGSWDRTVCVWDAKTGLVAAGPFTGHTDWVTSVAFTPDSKLVVSGSLDRTIRIWDVEKSRIYMAPFVGHTLGISSIAVSSDGKRIASSSWDKTIRVWDPTTGLVTAGPLEGHMDGVLCVAFLPDNKRLVSGSADCTILIWNIEMGCISAGPFVYHVGLVYSIAVSSDGKQLVSGSSDGTVWIRDVDTGGVIAGPFHHHDVVSSVAFHPDNNLVVSGSQDETIRIFDVSRQMTAYSLEGHTEEICSVAFSPNGKQVVSSSNDGMIRIWDVEDMQSPQKKMLRVISDKTKRRPSYDTGWRFREVGSRPDYHLVYWIPQSYRKGLICIDSSAIFGRARIARLDFSRFVEGDSWVNCYCPSSDGGYIHDLPLRHKSSTNQASPTVLERSSRSSNRRQTDQDLDVLSYAHYFPLVVVPMIAAYYLFNVRSRP